VTLHDEIQDRCQAFASDIALLVQQSLFDLLCHKQPTPMPPSALAKGEKRSPKAIAATVEALFDAVKASPGMRIEQLSNLLDIPTRDLMLPMRKLIAARSVKKTGQKRATSYFAR
jgi:hypothetical protein